MGLRFQWDKRKAADNVVKHGVSISEALTVFADPLARIFDDTDHSSVESREIIIGHSARRRLLVLCFIERPDAIRIINASSPLRNRRESENEDSGARARRETGSKVGTFVEDFATQPWRLKTVCSPRPGFQRAATRATKRERNDYEENAES